GTFARRRASSVGGPAAGEAPGERRGADSPVVGSASRAGEQPSKTSRPTSTQRRTGVTAGRCQSSSAHASRVGGRCRGRTSRCYPGGVTLAQRLLVAIGIVTVASTLALGAGVREAWRQAEEERFRWQLEQAFSRLENELRTSSKALTEFVGPLCRHDPIVESTLVDLRTGCFDAERRLSHSL